MSITYAWTSPEKVSISRVSPDHPTVYIPVDPGNIDYQAFLDWEAAGNTPDPAPAPPVVTPPTPAEKLKAAGLTVEELKALLAG